MGRPFWTTTSSRLLVTDADAIDVRDVLRFVQPDADSLRGDVLANALRGIPGQKFPAVGIERTPCNFGGHRIWFRCPTLRCGRRVKKLYAVQRLFGCRKCLCLDYPAQRTDRIGRVELRANKIRRRLGWAPGILNPMGDRPRHMHCRVFNRLFDEHERLAQALLIDLDARLRPLGEA